MSYRFDHRSEDEFIKDIKECSEFETRLMQLYVSWLNKKSTKKYSFTHTGVDNTGEFIKNDKEVHSGADFLLDCGDGVSHKIEIKHCKPERSRFHLKLSHINKCIDDDICIVNWMGTDTPEIRFCILTPNDLRKLLGICKQVTMWSKECLRINNKDVEWMKHDNFD